MWLTYEDMRSGDSVIGLLSCMWRSTWAISSCDDSAEMKEVLDTLPTSELLSPLQSRAAWGRQDMDEGGNSVTTN